MSMQQDPNTDAEQTNAWPGNQPFPGAQQVPPTVPPHGAQPTWSQPTPAGGGTGWVPPTPPTAPGSFGPGAGYPNPYGQPPAPPAKSGSKKGILAAVAIVAILAAAAAVIFLTPVKDKVFGTKGSTTQAGATTSSATSTSSSSTSTSSSPAATTSATAAPAPAPAPTAAPNTPAADPNVDPGQLQSFLATPGELGQLLNGAVMTPRGLVKQPFNGFDVSPFSCTGAAIPGVDTAYSGRGFTGFVGQVVNDDPGKNKVVQALISFPSTAAAKSFADSQTSMWTSCNNTQLAISAAGATDHTTAGVVTTHDDGTVSLMLIPPASVGRQCERAMSTRGNVVIDVRVCTANVGSLGEAIASDISKKITG